MKANIRLIFIILMITYLRIGQHSCHAMDAYDPFFDIFDHNPVKRIEFNDSTGVISLYIKIIQVQFPYTTESVVVVFKNKQRKEIFTGVSKELIRNLSDDDLYLIKFNCEDVFTPDKSMKNIFSDDNMINEIFVCRFDRIKKPTEYDWYPTTFDENSKMETFYYKLRLYYYNQMRNDKALQEFLQHRDEILYNKYDNAANSLIIGLEQQKDDFKRIDTPINEMVKLYKHFTLSHDPYINNILKNSFHRKFKALIDTIKQNDSFKYQQEIIDSLEHLRSLMNAANGHPIPINFLSPVESSIDKTDINQIESVLNQIIELIVINPKLTDYQLNFIEKQVIPLIAYKLKQISIFEPQNKIDEELKFAYYQELYKTTLILKDYILDKPDMLTNNNLLDSVLNSLPLTSSPNNISLENITLKGRLTGFSRFQSAPQLNFNLSNILLSTPNDTIKFVLLNNMNNLFLCDSMFIKAGMDDCNFIQSISDGIDRIKQVDLSTYNTNQFLDLIQEQMPFPPGLPQIKNIIYDYKRNKDNKLLEISKRIEDNISLRISDTSSRSRYILDSTAFMNLLQRTVFYHSANSITPYRYNSTIRRLDKESKLLSKLNLLDAYGKQQNVIKECENEISRLDSILTIEFNPIGYDSTYLSPQIYLLNELTRMNTLVRQSNIEIQEFRKRIEDSVYSYNLKLVLALDTIPFSYYDSIQMMTNRLTALNNKLEENFTELPEYRDRNIMNATLPDFFQTTINKPNPIGLESYFYVICKPKEYYSLNDFKRDSSFVINLLNRFPKVAENYYFNIMPDDKRKDFIMRELKSKDIFLDGSKVEFKNIDVEALAYSLSKKFSVNERDIAEQLSYKINYLNMDTYAGAGYSFWQNQDNRIRFQPFNLFFNTRLDSTKTYKGQYKVFGLDIFPFKIQPYIEGNIQTYSGRGIMTEFGYGGRFLNSREPIILKKAKVCLSPSIQMQGTLLNTEIWKFNNKKGSKEDSLHVKSFYEIESKLQMNVFLYWPDSNKLGLTYNHSWSLSSIDRTYNLVLANDNSKIFKTEHVDYFANSATIYYCNKNVRVCCGYKWYNITEPNELTNFYNKLWYIQFQLRLNKN